jgi:ABC-type Na+ efflux pump permease subunit
MSKAFCMRNLFFLVFFLAQPAASYAYIDPGSGSYFLQMFIGIFIGAIFAVKIYWAKIRSFFSAVLKKGGGDGRKKDL